MFCFFKNSSHNPIRTNNSLLESYIDVVNENTKKVGKKVFGKYFSTRGKFLAHFFLIFRKISENPTCFDKIKNFRAKIFRESKNIFPKTFFPTVLNFR